VTVPDWTFADIRQAAAPPAGCLDLWLIGLDEGTDRLRAVLNEEERMRAARFVRPADGPRYTVARASLRTLLGACLQREPHSLEFAVGEWGKPSLDAADAVGLAFNLAHSGDLALIGVARAESIGVDIEAMRQIEDWRDLAERNFAPGEQRTLFAAADEDHFDSFFATWTRKEAVIKFWGQGLSADLDSFEVTTHARAPAQLLSRNDAALAHADMWAFEPRIGFWGAAAAPVGQITTLRFFMAAH
jgi:4'-phosphopantetheinyl transferase